MSPLRQRFDAIATSQTSPWAGALLSLTVSVLCYVETARIIDSDAQQRFVYMARNVQTTIEARIKSYTDLLRGAAGLFQAMPDVSRDQFGHYVETLSMETNFPGIAVINFARSFSDQQRAEFERAMRAQLANSGTAFPEFSINPPGRRPNYTVITYIEPRSSSAGKLGFDMEARRFAAQSLAESRDTGNVAASGMRIDALSGPNQYAMAMRLPLYQSGMPAQTVEERRAAYFGSIGIAFGVNRLVQGVLDQMPIKGTRLTVIEMNPPPPEPGQPPIDRLLFDSQAAEAAATKPTGAADSSTFHIKLPITFNRHLWEANFNIRKSALYTRFDVYYPWWAMLAGFVTSSLLYALFNTLASSRRSAIKMAEEMTAELRASQAKLQQSHETLRRLAAHADQIKEGERKRIAREIHDDLGQNLLALRIEAEMLSSRTRGTHGRLHTRAGATLRQIDTTIKSVRQIINDLRPTVLDLGLNAAVDWQVADFQRRTGIACELFENETELLLHDHCATAFFRILQESLSNIARHAGASRVRIELHLRDRHLSMTVSDNGIGMPPGGRSKLGSFGLVGIEERVNLLGGTFLISSEAGVGTSIVVSVPIDVEGPFEQAGMAARATVAEAATVVDI